MMNSATKITVKMEAPFPRPQATRVMPQFWCTACAKLRWMVSLEEAKHLLSTPNYHSQKTNDEHYVQTITRGHQMETSSGAILVCLHALLPQAF
jgi:hypothetical protein